MPANSRRERFARREPLRQPPYCRLVARRGSAGRFRRRDGLAQLAAALDPDYAVWRAFANQYWPAAYIADGEGRIRHHQFGEGGYAESEMVIQWLLRENGSSDVPDDLVSGDAEGLEAQADWANLESPE